VEQELLTLLEHMWSRNYLLFWSTCGAGTTYSSGAHVEQELLTLLEHMSYPRFLMGFMLLEL
jgi:hypothetical protein